jgi:hypothetical protein
MGNVKTKVISVILGEAGVDGRIILRWIVS